MPTIIIPAALRKYTKNSEKVVIAGTNLKKLLLNFIIKFPETGNFIFNEKQELNDFLMVVWNNKIIRSKKGLAQPLKDDDVIEILLSIAGG